MGRFTIVRVPGATAFGMLAISLLAVVAMAGCSPSPRPLEWGLRLPPGPLRERAVYVEAAIRRGSCTGEVLYAEEFAVAEGMGRSMPGRLGPGTYAFTGRARDAACIWFASGCLVVELPHDGPVIVDLEASGETAACPPSECRAGRCGGDAGVGPMDAATDAGPGSTDGGDTGDAARDAATDAPSCPPGQTLCGTACVDLQTDERHCGGCGRSCPAGQTCVSGRCQCPAGQTLCGTACVDTMSDARHCGMCGRACSAGESCMGGVCLPNRVVEIEGGSGFTCARLLDGTVYCWGANGGGQLDDGTTMTRYVATGPTRSTDPRMMANDAVDLSVGAGHACIVRRNGRVHCWGLNSDQQLGDGSATDVVQVAAGGAFTCAVRAPSGMPRHVVCWGDNYSHQLGTTGITETSTPVRVMGTDGAVQVTAGGEFACARLETGSVVCWGSNSQGQLGRGSTTPSSSEVPMAVPLAGSAVDIDAGYHFACAALTTGAVQCWGNNVWGQLGDEMAVTPTTTPVTARSLTGVVEVAAGQNHTCARTMGGAVTCWGDNRHGQLGDGTTMRRMSPGASISGLMAVDIAAGYDHSCAVRSGGPPQCWGGNDTGQIGNGDSSRANVLSPTDVMGLP